MIFKDLKKYEVNIRKGKTEERIIVSDVYLTSLEGCPEKLDILDCSYNKLTSLEYSPKIVDTLICHHNELTSLEYFPKNLISDLDCSYNEITSLEYLPKIINGDLNCSNNKLTSLKYSPEIIEGNFHCQNNNIKSLKGSPKTINGDLDRSDNNLISLEYCSKEIKGYLFCKNNPELKNIKEQIIKYQIKAVRYFNDERLYTFIDIKEEFENYGNYLLKKEQNRLKQKTKENIKINKIKLNKNDYGLSI